MKVSPSETKNKYGVLEVEETLESGLCPIDEVFTLPPPIRADSARTLGQS